MGDSQRAFQQAMNLGHSAAWDQQWERAAEYYRQALRHNPQSPQALSSLGLALIELQRFEEALQCYQQAARFSPEDPVPFEKIGQLGERLGYLDLAARGALRAGELYLKGKEAQKAIENWERVIRLEPQNLQAYSRLSIVYERLGEKHKAVAAYLAVAALLQKAGQAEKARQAVEYALTLLPNHEEAQRALRLLKDFKPLPLPARPAGGTAPLRMAQVRQLEAPSGQAEATPAEMDPITEARQKALTILAGMLFEAAEEGDEGSARRGLQAIVSGTTGSLRKPFDRNRIALHLSQAIDSQMNGDYAQAADELQRAMEAGLTHAAAAFDVGWLHLQAGRLEGAFRQLQHAVKHADFALASRLLMGEILLKKGRLSEAALEYLEALKLADVHLAPPDKGDELAQLYDVLIEAQRSQADEARSRHLCANIQELLARPDWRTQLRQARQQLPSAPEQGSLIPLAELLVEAHGSRVTVLIARLKELTHQGSWRTALEEAFFALSEAPFYLPLHAQIGEILLQAGHLEQAVEKFRIIAQTYAMRGELQQAIAFDRRVVELKPSDGRARLRLIEHLLAFGKAESAVEEYLQLADLYYRLAELPQARHAYTEALRIAQQANLERDRRIAILRHIADIDLQSLEWRKALRVLEQIRTLRPEDVETRSQIIELNLRLEQEQQALSELDDFIAYLTSHNQLARLTEFLEGLVQQYPQSVPLRRRLAESYRQKGEIPLAVAQLDAIGEMLLQAGEQGAAQQVIEAIIALNPPNKAEYQLLLEQLRQKGSFHSAAPRSE